MKRVYLTGQRTFSNRGCEAIVRSTVAALRAASDDIEVLVPSDNIRRDLGQWPEASANGVQFVPEYMPRHTRYWVNTQRLPFRFLKRAGWPFPFPNWLKEQLASVDMVLSVGGDNYSLDYRLPSLLQGTDSLAMNLGKPVVIWGASVGPFEREPQFVPTIRKHLGRMHQIFTRETYSRDYLVENLGLSNVSMMADPAFALAGETVDSSAFWPEHAGAGVIGLNVSPLIERYKLKDQDLVGEVTEFVKHIVQVQGYGVLLVPHVAPLDNSAKNNDSLYMSHILDACSDLRKKVGIVPRGYNAAQLKGVISQLRFFIGARTHSTIAALSTAVPTISISYSVKAKGINRDLFGNDEVILPTQEVSSASLLQKLDYLAEHESELKSLLLDRMPSHRTSVQNAAEFLVALL